MIRKFICDLSGLGSSNQSPEEIWERILNKMLLLGQVSKEQPYSGYVAQVLTDTKCELQCIAISGLSSIEEYSVIVQSVVCTSEHMYLPLRMCDKHIGQIYIKGDMTQLYKDADFSIMLDALSTHFYYSVIQQKELVLLKQQSMNKAKGLLIANVSHELRTPLNAIIGMLALLEDTSMNEYQWNCIEIMRESSLDLMVLINDILDISKLEAGEMQLYPSSVNILEIIEKSHKIVGQNAYDKGLQLDYKIDKNVPESIIVDPNRFKQMMKNLLSNAVKFTKEGSIKTHVSLATDEEIVASGLPPKISMPSTPAVPEHIPLGAVVPANKIEPYKLGEWKYLKFTITDTGIGIDAVNIPTLFKSFTQVDGSITKEYEGTGLGLSITAQLCQLMKGFIGVNSVKNIGSSFYFIIPVQEYLPHITKNIDMALLKGKTFLVVDDNSKNLMRITALLDKWGIEYRECENPQRAVISYINNPKYHFDLGLLDIVMPQINGNELAAKIASSQYSFPLIALSSSTQQINSVSPAFSAHINKPYGDDELLEVIFSVLQESRRGDPVSAPTPPSKIEKLKTVSGFFGLVSAEKKTSVTGNIQFSPAKSQKFDNSKKHRIDKDFREPIQNSNITILVVEDQQRNMDMIIKMLNSAGYQHIDTAYNGLEAIEKIKQNRGVPFSETKSQYDVILMDIVMPKMDGMQATKIISGLFTSRKYRPKIIAVTARITDNSYDEYMESQIDDILYKPIQSISSLIEKLKNI